MVVMPVAACLLVVANLHNDSLERVRLVTNELASSSLEKEWLRKTQAFTETVADLLIQPVYTSNIHEINDLAQYTGRNEIIRHIYVAGIDGLILGDGSPGGEKIGQKLADPDILSDLSAQAHRLDRQSDLLEVFAPILLGDQRLGTVVIGFYTHEIVETMDVMDGELNTIFDRSFDVGLKRFLFYGFGIAAVGLILCYLIARGLVRPIKALVHETQKIRSGDFSVSLQVSSRDEMGELNRSFILMSEELKARENSLKKAKEELEIRVQQRTADLVAVNEKLSQEIYERQKTEDAQMVLEKRLRNAEKMEALGTLAGGVAHDLNNILTGLVGYPELILMELPEDSPLRATAETIKTSGEKASAIVQDLLTLARRGVVQRKVINLNQIITHYFDSPEGQQLRELHRNVEFEMNLDPDLLNVTGSPHHLTKNLMNLVTNAAEAMPDGGRITISTCNKYVDQPVGRHETVSKGDYALLTVSDTGVGISEADLSKIFEPFFTKKEMGRSGTGLGMAVVWGTVKDHEGYIDVKTCVGQGTTFEIYLPVTHQTEASESDIPSIAIYQGDETVLVVDDDESQRVIADRMLSKLGYNIQLASSGEAAVELMRSETVDLVILDMIMGEGMDGLETYRKIIDRRPGQKAIITSGFSESDRVKEAQRLGAGCYIKKPFQMKQLAEAVRTELDGFHP